MMPFMRRKKKGVKCVLQSDSNELLADGVATAAEEGAFEITSEKGLPPLAMGSLVKLVMHGEDGAARVWRGRVYYSNREKLRVEEATLCSGNEKRKTYRVNVNNDARLTAYSRGGGSLRKAWVEMVKLRDISSGGCLIETRKDLELEPGNPGLRLMLRITLHSSVEEVEVAVKSRLNKKSDVAMYGLEFVELNQRVAHAIDMYVLKLQQDQIRKSRNSL